MRRISWCLWLAFVVSAAAWAQTPPPAPAPPGAAPVATANPYAATVPVAGTSDAQRSAAIAAALTQVLQQTAPGFSPGADVLAGASGYVRNYHYQRAAGGGLELQVEFDPRAVGRVVAQAGSANVAGAPAVNAATPATSAPAGAGATPASTPTATGATPGAPSSGTGQVWVTGIDGTHAFASLLAMLRGDAQLSRVMPVGADAGGVMLQVTFSQPLATVLAALETPNSHLAQASTPHPGADATLQWTP